MRSTSRVRSIASIVFFFVSVATLLLLGSDGVTGANADPERVKQLIVQRLLARADALETQYADGAAVRAELRRATPDKYLSVLNEWIDRGSAYARSMHAAISGFENPNEMTVLDLECTEYSIRLKLRFQAARVRESADEVSISHWSDIPAKLDAMAKALSVGEDENIELPPECEITGPTSRFVGEFDLSTQWDSRCFAATDDIETDVGALTLPSVASILYDDGQSGPKSFCTGTLIAPNLVITAAHCFCMTSAKQPRGRFYRTARSCASGVYRRGFSRQAALDPSHHKVFFQHAGVYDIKSIVVHPDFRWTGRYPNADLVILVLDRPVIGVAPTPINTMARLRPGTVGIGAGYGYYTPIDVEGRVIDTSEVLDRTGLKLAGLIRTAACPFALRRRGMICWRYRRNQIGRLIGSTCNGDSGGPLFAESRGRTYLVGVTSAGGRGCQAGTRAYDFEIYSFRNWISRMIRRYGVDPQPAANAPYVEQLKCTYCQACDEDLLTRDKKRVENVVIDITSPRTNRLRVAANCTPGLIDNTFSLSLYLLNAANERIGDEHCGTPENSSVHTCEVPANAGQRWAVRIRDAADRECQIMATALGD